jgi:hypothetical protein
LGKQYRLDFRAHDPTNLISGQMAIRQTAAILWESDNDGAHGKKLPEPTTTAFRLTMQNAGNLVEYEGTVHGPTVWASDTVGR